MESKVKTELKPLQGQAIQESHSRKRESLETFVCVCGGGGEVHAYMHTQRRSYPLPCSIAPIAFIRILTGFKARLRASRQP